MCAFLSNSPFLVYTGLQKTVNPSYTLDVFFMFPQMFPLTVIALKFHSYYLWIDHIRPTFALEIAQLL